MDSVSRQDSWHMNDEFEEGGKHSQELKKGDKKKEKEKI